MLTHMGKEEVFTHMDKEAEAFTRTDKAVLVAAMVMDPADITVPEVVLEAAALVAAMDTGMDSMVDLVHGAASFSD